MWAKGVKKHHTPTSERVAIAEAVAERLKVQAEHRMKAGKAPCGNISTGSDEAGKTRDLAAAKAVAERLKGRAGNPKLKANSGNISPIEIGRTTDLAAAKAGFGSGKTLEAAQAVIAKGSRKSDTSAKFS